MPPSWVYRRYPWAGEIAVSDRRPADGELTIGMTTGSGLVWVIPGEIVPTIGLLAIRLNRDGLPQTLHIPDSTPERIEIAQSSPRRVADEDDGA